MKIDNNKYCVYFHINPLKNHIFYVGIGNKKRPFDKNQRSLVWKRTVAKYNFIVDVIETQLSIEHAKEREKWYIKRIGRKNLGLGTLVNLTDGGDGIIGFKHTTEFKEARRLAKLNKPMDESVKEKIGNSNKGKLKGRDPWNKGRRGIYSDEVLKKMSVSASIRRFSDETKLKMSKSQTKRWLSSTL